MVRWSRAFVSRPKKSSFARGPAPRSSTRPSQRLGRWGWRRIGGARRRRRWCSSPPGQVGASIRFRAQNSSGALGGALLSLSEVVASSWTLELVADRWRTAAAALALDERALCRVVARRVRSSSPRSIRAASRAAGVVHLVPKPRRASAASSARPLGRTRERFGQSHRFNTLSLLSSKKRSLLWTTIDRPGRAAHHGAGSRLCRRPRRSRRCSHQQRSGAT